MTRRKQVAPSEETVELLRTLLILQLKQLGADNKKIRKILGCGMSRVNNVLKNLPKEKKRKGEGA